MSCVRVRACVLLSRGASALSAAPLLYFTHHFYQFVAHFHTLPHSLILHLSPFLRYRRPKKNKKIPHPPPFVTAAAAAAQSKICKRSWVLHECVERVPENVDAAKELLQYGLKGTDLEALIAIGNREDGGR